MKTKLLSLFVLCASIGYCDPSFSDYKTHFVKYEGNKNQLYRDSKGYLTVGIGHKFEKGEKTKKFYSNSEIDTLFKTDLEEAKKIAKRVFPSFDKQPDDVQILLVSLCFNLGEGGINKFKQFKKAIDRKQYSVAADELKDSLWYRQTGKRGISYIKILKDIA
jgi:lysozyme